MAFPKMLALAERAWARPDRSDDWNRFANTLGQRELARLDRLAGGVAYRIPPPGGVIVNGTLYANVAFPGLTIRYTTDGSDPETSSAEYRGPTAVGGTARLRAFDTRGRGGRICVVSP
jgi:hexosaminidase